MSRIQDVMLPHDFVTWHLGGRGEGSGDGPWRGLGHRLLVAGLPAAWLPDLLLQALGRDVPAAAHRLGRRGG